MNSDATKNLDFEFKKKNYSKAKYLISEIDPLSSSLIISQAKNWIDKSNYDVFNNFFSCKSENDILAEFFFLIGSLYSSQEDYAKSNFYINISNYLNPKFYFNLTHLISNYIENKNYEKHKEDKLEMEIEEFSKQQKSLLDDFQNSN